MKKQTKKQLIQISQILIYFILIWLLIALIIPFTIMPNQGIFSTETQQTKYLEEFSQQFKAQTKEQTLSNVFNYTTSTYTGKEEWLKLLFLYHKHFYHNIEKLIDKKQFLSCHVQALFLKTILINTGQFQEKDFVKQRVITNHFIAHQYLIVQTDENTKYKADPFLKILEKIN